MDFEWNPAKAETNLAKHGVDFVDAVEVFQDRRLMIVVDGRFAEPRFRAIGTINGRVLSVAFTMRGEVCRIINARKASRNERGKYGSL